MSNQEPPQLVLQYSVVRRNSLFYDHDPSALMFSRRRHKSAIARATENKPDISKQACKHSGSVRTCPRPRLPMCCVRGARPSPRGSGREAFLFGRTPAPAPLRTAPPLFQGCKWSKPAVDLPWCTACDGGFCDHSTGIDFCRPPLPRPPNELRPRPVGVFMILPVGAEAPRGVFLVVVELDILVVCVRTTRAPCM